MKILQWLQGEDVIVTFWLFWGKVQLEKTVFVLSLEAILIWTNWE